MIKVLFISKRKEVHSTGHCLLTCKRKCFSLFFLIFQTPKVKELIALVTEQTINKIIKGFLFQSSIVKVIEFILFDPEKLFTSVLPRLTLLPYF